MQLTAKCGGVWVFGVGVWVCLFFFGLVFCFLVWFFFLVGGVVWGGGVVFFFFFKCINSATTWKSLKSCNDFLQSERFQRFIVICTTFHSFVALRHHKEN